MAAKTVRKIPFQIAVRVMSLFTKLRIRFGNTGAINPRATMSSMTVTKMNGIAACRFFIAREESTQRCSGGFFKPREGGKRHNGIGGTPFPKANPKQKPEGGNFVGKTQAHTPRGRWGPSVERGGVFWLFFF